MIQMLEWPIERLLDGQLSLAGGDVLRVYPTSLARGV